MGATVASRSLNAASARRTIATKLETFLRETRLCQVHFADSSVAPPPLAYCTNFPRLSIPIEGFHAMELPVRGRSQPQDVAMPCLCPARHGIGLIGPIR